MWDSMRTGRFGEHGLGGHWDLPEEKAIVSDPFFLILANSVNGYFSLSLQYFLFLETADTCM